MGKKRAEAGVAAPVFPFPETAHFSNYGFDPQLVHFLSQPKAKWPSTRRQQQQPPTLESARFKLQKPISKKKHHHNNKQQQQRRRWWSSAASAALLLFKRPSSSGPNVTAGPAPPPASPYGYSAVPLYLADVDGSGDDATAACACWAPTMRSGHHLAAAELGTASVPVPYVRLRNADRGRGAVEGGAAPAMPMYFVT